MVAAGTVRSQQHLRDDRAPAPRATPTQELLRPGMSVVVSVNTKGATERAPAQVAGSAD